MARFPIASATIPAAAQSRWSIITRASLGLSSTNITTGPLMVGVSNTEARVSNSSVYFRAADMSTADRFELLRASAETGLPLLSSL